MTSLQMPKVDKSIVQKKDKIVSDLQKILKKDNVLFTDDQVRPYETDALSAYKQAPLVVVLPENVNEVTSFHCN